MNARATSGQSSRLTAEVLRGPALADLGMRVIAGQTGFQRPISWGRIQRPGLALAGFLPFIKPGRIQIVGESELHYFATMPPELRQERVAAICSLPVAAFVVTKGQRVPAEIARECERHNVPLLVSDQTTSVVIGKSECALDLIQRGHRLVADDVVEIRKYPNGSLVGRAAEMIRYHMELRGIGIINIKHLFGVSAVRASKSIELVIELERWDPTKKYDRLGLDGETYSILDRSRPFLRLPVASGRNIALLIEIAARNELLKTQGYDAAKEFALKVDEQIARNMQSTARRPA